jgi:hypothetical protein
MNQSKENKLIKQYNTNLEDIKNLSIFEDIYIQHLNNIINYLKKENLLAFLKECLPYPITITDSILIRMSLNNIDLNIIIYNKNYFAIQILFKEDGHLVMNPNIEPPKNYDNIDTLLKDLKRYVIQYKDDVNISENTNKENDNISLSEFLDNHQLGCFTHEILSPFQLKFWKI